MENLDLAGSSGTELEWGPMIKRWRIDVAGMTQAALAERLGVDHTTISRWERGRDKPDLQMQRRLRALIEPAPCHSSDCQLLTGLVAALLEPGSEANIQTWRQFARATLDRIRREACHAKG